MIPKTSFLENLICSFCGRTFNAQEIHNLCICGKVLFASYDLEKAKESYSDLEGRSFDIWRHYEIMPVLDQKYRLTLGEGWTPLIKIQQFGKIIKQKNLFMKDEGQNPTGSFKARGLCAAVAKAGELGIKECTAVRLD